MRISSSLSHTEPLQILSVPSVPLRRGELRVRVAAIGVNPVDWKMREGGPLGLAQRVVGPRGPRVVGVDFAGTVCELGEGTRGLELGARVVGGTDFSRGQRGSYADEVVVRPDQCAQLPASVGFEDAACLPVAAVTPWMALTEHTKIRAGNRVLVLGASGGVGLFCLALTKLLGATAVGVCSTRNTHLVRDHGAIAIDYTAADALVAAKEHGTYDLILNAVGSDVYPTSACEALLAPNGLIDLVVVRPADYLAVAFHRRVTTVLGRPTKARLEPLVAALAEGKLKPLVAARFSLADAEAAHTLSRAGKVVGKLLLLP